MSHPVKNFEDFKRELTSNPELQKQFKEDPVLAVQKFRTTPLDNDRWVYRIIVAALGATILSIVIGILILVGSGEISDDKNVPTILTAIGSAAIGAIAGLLVPAPRK